MVHIRVRGQKDSGGVMCYRLTGIRHQGQIFGLSQMNILTAQ
jgi:hypothetical protein